MDLASTARAFATYSLVPYLGIAFCPGAVVVGAVGVLKSYRSNETGDTRFVCYASTIVGVVVLGIQLLLWWIMCFGYEQRECKGELHANYFDSIVVGSDADRRVCAASAVDGTEPDKAPAPPPAPTTVKAKYEGGVFGYTKTMEGTHV